MNANITIRFIDFTSEKAIGLRLVKEWAETSMKQE
jgi:hypothetical protein